MTKLTFGEAAFDSHGSLGPWSDSMTGASMARLERHYLGLTVHSWPYNFFPERLGEGRFLGAVSLSSMT